MQRKTPRLFLVRTRKTLRQVGTLARARVATTEPEQQALAEQPSALVAATPAAARDDEPRVGSALVPRTICVGAWLFFDEKVSRTCGSCHPANNHFTIARTFMQALPANDPLFVNDDDASFPLAEPETPELKNSRRALREIRVTGRARPSSCAPTGPATA